MVNLQIIDASGGFAQVFNTWKTFFVSVLSFMDSVHILPGVSLLDFNIAAIIFGLIFTPLFSVVRSAVSNSMSGVSRSKNTKKGDD